MKKPFFARFGLTLLMVVFFMAPFALRGARMSVQRMTNNVKDWLPDDFAETRQLDWFREHFLGEQFVVVSWEGCTGDVNDVHFQRFVDSFFPEVPPSEKARRLNEALRNETPLEVVGETDVVIDDDRIDQLIAAEPVDARAAAWPIEVERNDFIDPDSRLYVRQLNLGDLPPADEWIGNQLGLFYVENEFTNWGGQNEKWIKGHGEQWYYLTPEGELYRWAGGSSVLQPFYDGVKRLRMGPNVEGELVASLGPLDGPWYYEDPHRLSARMFKTVTTGPGVLYQLTQPGGVLADNPDEAKRRLIGTLFGYDGEKTCLVATLSDAAKKDLRLAIGRGILGKPQGRLLQMGESAGINPPPQPDMLPPMLSWMVPKPPAPELPQIKLGGPAVDNVAIDEEGQITLVRLVGLSLLVGLGLSWITFRSVNLTIMVFLVGGLSAVASLSFVYWSGQSVDAVLMSMPSLVYVLGLSGAVHIVNYYRDAVGEIGLRRAAGEALRVGWKPCTLAAITTGLGLISLNTSHIVPIRKFGVFSALGVVATLGLLFTYLPSALQTWPPRRYRRERKAAVVKSKIDVWIETFWRHVGEIVMARYGWALAICLLLLVGLGLGLRQVNTDVQLLKMFDADATIIRDYHWLEKNIGKLVPMEVVIRVDEDVQRRDGETDEPRSPSDSASTSSVTSLNFLERMEIVQNVQQVLEARFGDAGSQAIGHAMSAVTFSIELPGPGGSSRTSSLRGGISRSLEGHRDEFLASDYLRIDKQDGAELWRISLRVGALSDIDYGVFVEALRETVEPVIAAYQVRSQILQAVAEQQGADAIRNTSIYLVGAPFGKSRSAGELISGETDTDVAANSFSPAEVFSKVLGKLLINAGLKLQDWHDPNYAPPEDWESVLQQQDCIVLIGDEATYQDVEWSQYANLFFDVREEVTEALQADGTVVNTTVVANAGSTPAVNDPAVDAKPINPVAPAAPERMAYTVRSESGAVQQVEREIAHDVSAIYTGLVPVVYKAQRTLLESLIVSTGWAFVMIAVVMVLVVRSAPAGLLSMLPNVFPVIAVFGLMGWSGTLVDIGSMMTASVAMGVAVDDTIHFLTWFRRGLDEGRNRIDSILQAYERVGMAMTQTTAIGGLGLSIFAFSTFTPTQRFGTLMLALLLAALIGDLIFLPALLASPIGRVFDRRHSGHNEPSTDKVPDQNASDKDRVRGPNTLRRRPYPVSTQGTQRRPLK